MGSNSAAVIVAPSAPATAVKVCSASGSLLESEATNVPEPSAAETTTAERTSTSPSRLLAPPAGV